MSINYDAQTWINIHCKNDLLPRLRGHLECCNNALRQCDVECTCEQVKLDPTDKVGACRKNCIAKIAARADNWEAAIKRHGG